MLSARGQDSVRSARDNQPCSSKRSGGQQHRPPRGTGQRAVAGGLAPDPQRQDVSVSPLAGRGSRSSVLGALVLQLGLRVSVYRPGERNHIKTVCLRDHDSAGSRPAWGGRKHGLRKSQGTRIRRKPGRTQRSVGSTDRSRDLANPGQVGHWSHGGGRWGPAGPGQLSVCVGQESGNARVSPHGAWEGNDTGDG